MSSSSSSSSSSHAASDSGRSSSSPHPRKRQRVSADSDTESSSSDAQSDSDSAASDAEEDDTPVLSHAEQRRQRKKEKRALNGAAAASADKSGTKKGKEKVKNTADLPPSKLPKRQNSVWVGNLSFKTTPAALKAFFEGVGEITRIHMPTKMATGGPEGKGARKENRGSVPARTRPCLSALEQYIGLIPSASRTWTLRRLTRRPSRSRCPKTHWTGGGCS